MAEKTQKELLREVYQGIYGIPDTEEHGLLGDVKSLVTEVKKQNDRIGKSEQRISRIWGILIGVSSAIGGILGYLGLS